MHNELSFILLHLGIQAEDRANKNEHACNYISA